MQNNDLKHNATNTRAWILFDVWKHLKAPPQTADINVIEIIGDHLKRKISNHRIS